MSKEAKEIPISDPRAQKAANEMKAAQFMQAFFKAIDDADLDTLKHMLSEEIGFDINTANEKGIVGIFEAAAKGKIDVLKFLIENKANLRVLAPSGNTVLHFAVQGGFRKIVHLLLDLEPALLNKPNKQGETPLSHACFCGYDKIAFILLDKGAVYEFVNAAEMTVALLSVFHSDGDDKSRVRILKFFLGKNEKFANHADIQGRSPLHCAAGNGFVECVKLLLENGANPFAKMKNGQTPMEVSKDNCKELILNKMKELKAKTDLEESKLQKDLEVAEKLEAQQKLESENLQKEENEKKNFKMEAERKAAEAKRLKEEEAEKKRLAAERAEKEKQAKLEAEKKATLLAEEKRKAAEMLREIEEKENKIKEDAEKALHELNLKKTAMKKTQELKKKKESQKSQKVEVKRTTVVVDEKESRCEHDCDAMNEALIEKYPQWAVLALPLTSLAGLDLDSLSSSQLDVLFELHSDSAKLIKKTLDDR